jgi:hypothetical protein
MNHPDLPSSRGCAAKWTIVFAAVWCALGAGLRLLAADDIPPATRTQIASLLEEKAARTPAQRKVDSQLLYFAKKSRKQAITSAVPSLQTDVRADLAQRVLVDIKGTISPDLVDFITVSGGTVVNQFAAFGALRALLPVEALETVAARAEVRFLEPAAQATTNVGSVTSQGDRTHRADTARATLPTTGGSGIKVGVLSDGVNSLAASIASRNLNANTTVIAGQAGSGDEGTAMLEIIQDLVPNAQLYFATAFNGPASFASNILALQAAGCTVIVDDVTYFNESPFQDQVITQAVSTVSAAGVMYFSSARNSGSKDKGTSGTWEGDFTAGGVATIGSKSGSVHDFGGGVTFNTVGSGGSSRRVDLFWADPLGASSNDYDLFVTDATGTVLRSSTNTQSGTQDPYESTSTLNAGERIVIVKATAAAPRFLHLDTGRAVLAISTAGNVRGHNAAGAANAFSVAATDVNNSPSPNFFVGGAANPVESFSSDGPRRMFFNPNGTALTPGNFSSTGGTVLLKPDFTAADGVATSVTGFTTFYGTSAAAPHAAAIAALLQSYNRALTPAQIRALLSSTALDIESAGYDRDSGSGIITALAAIQAAPAPDPLTITATGLAASGLQGGPFNPTSGTYTLTNNSVAPLNWTAAKTQSWTTLSPTSGTLAAGASTTVTVALDATASAALGLGNYSDTVTITNVTTGFAATFPVTLAVLSPSPVVVFDSFTGATLTFTSGTPRSFIGIPTTLSAAAGTSNINITSGTAYLVSTAAVSYTNVRLNITFWGAASGATSGTTAAFSNSRGTFSFDLGALTTAANTFYSVDFTLPSSVVLPGQTGGVTCNWQGDTGSGLVSTNNLTSLLRYGSAPATGTLSLGTAGTNGFYQNISSETDGNFLGSSFRFFTGVANQGLALKLSGSPADTTPPTAAVTPTGTTTNASPLTFTLAFSKPVTGLTTAGLTVTNGTVGTLSGSGSSYTIPVTPLGQGAVTCKVNAGAAQDSSGNNNTASNTASVVFDSVTQTPTLTAPASSAISSSPLGVNFVLPENALPASVKLTFSGAASRTLTLAATQETSGPHTFSFNPASPTAAAPIASISGGTSIPDGLYAVTLSYQDALGNPAATASATNVRIDTTPPTLDLPAPITVTATSPAGAVVTYPASATDPGGSGVASAIFTPASGGVFALGTTTVNASATDNAGNTATGSFSVTVNPNPPPSGGTFTVSPASGVHPGDPLNVTAAGWTDPDLPLSYQFFQGTAALNAPGASTTFSFNAPAPGTYVFKVRVTDSAGSFAEATQSLTVTALSSVESWRQSFFGLSGNGGTRADDADYDLDGQINLLEFAFGTDPTRATSGPAALIFTGTFAGGGLLTSPGQPVVREESSAGGADRRGLFIRRVNFTTAGLTYTPQFSPDLQTWITSADVPTTLADDGTLQVVSVPYPASTPGGVPLYFRVKIRIDP